MDLVLLFLLLFICTCVKPCPDGDLSSRAMLPVRGLCAVGIVFHHVTQNVACDGTLIFKYFDFTGAMFVAVFFAVSGYALAAQYDAKGEDYLKGFLRKRLTSLLAPYVVYVLLYAGLRLALNLLTGTSDPLGSTSGTVLYSWYVKAIVFLYVLYYLARRLDGGRPWGFWVLLSAGLAGYILFCRHFHYGIWWYNSILAFPFGMVCYGRYRTGKAGSPWRSMGAALVLFGLALVLRLKVLTDGIPGLMMDGVISLAVPVLLFSFLRRFSLQSRVLNWLGSRSYELYLAQGLPVLLLKSGLTEVTSPLLFSAITLTASLIIAEAVHRLDRKLLNRLTG